MWRDIKEADGGKNVNDEQNDQLNDELIDVIWALIYGLPEEHRERFIDQFSDTYELYTVSEVLEQLEKHGC